MVVNRFFQPFLETVTLPDLVQLLMVEYVACGGRLSDGGCCFGCLNPIHTNSAPLLLGLHVLYFDGVGVVLLQVLAPLLVRFRMLGNLRTILKYEYIN